MRKRKAMAKAGAALLSAAMLVTSNPVLTQVITAKEADDVKPSAKSDVNQVSTEAQTTYINHYDGSERSADFDASWSFHLGDASGAELASYNDSNWDVVNVPHDYSIIQDYDPNLEGESGYFPGGTGWYRKNFTLGEEVKGKNVRIDFDGVYNNATIYINGHKLGSHPYGYSPFSYDLTDYINYEGENLIAVKVEHVTPSSRWYSGSGIYRDVHLTITDNVYVDRYGTTIRSANLETQKDGDVDTTVDTVLVNDTDQAKTVTVRQTMRKKGSDAVAATVTSDAQTIEAGSEKTVSQTMKVNRPDLWDTENPNLYINTTEIIEDGKVIDTYETRYGYRYFKFEAETGFWLNGKAVKINGVCMHHDQGSLGAVANRRATERQVEILKEMGVNSIRTSHNPASQALLDICDEQGILLMEEFFDGWSTVKNGNTYDYSSHFNEVIADDNEIIHKKEGEVWSQWDLQEVIRRGRNCPSIIIWDIGNEVEHGNTSEFPTIADNLIRWIKEMDDRPFVLGDNKTLFNDTANSRVVRQKIVEAGGLVGSNYGLANNLQSLYRNDHPDWKFIGTENVSAVNSRGVYNRIGSQRDLNGDQQLTSYDYSCVDWGHRASQAMIGFVQNDWFAGEYVWTGFDYIGEPTPWNGISAGIQGTWPSPKNSYFGIIDTAGFPKDTYYFYRSIWKQDDTTLHVLPAWKENVVYKDAQGNVPVVVYSNAHSVKLEFTPSGSTTKQDLGTKTFTEYTTANGYKYRKYEGADKDSTDDKNLYLTWKVPYADGTITATAYDTEGNVISKTVGRNSVSTYGAPAKLEATADRTEISADGKDLTYISVDVKDANGLEAADASNRVTFTVEGEGKLVGVDNGNSPDHQSYQDDNRAAFSGKVLAIVQSTKKSGTIKVTASADGLESSTVLINSTGSDEAVKPESLTYSKSAYVRAGVKPTLPATAEMTKTDGTKENVSIVWEDIKAEDLAHTGTVVVKGDAQGTPVSFYVNVIDEIGAIANYSAAVQTGAEVVLPENRPVLMPDGSKLDANFPVEWEDITSKDFSKPGTYVINGTADVLGTVYPVTASIRVTDPEESFGSNEVILHGFSVTQSIPADKQSDNLMAIKDGNRNFTSGNGTNASIWSSYNWAQDGNTQSSITISLDTAALLGKMDLFFVEDSYSARWPEANTLKIEVSATGDDWTEVDYTETIGAADGVVKQYSYTFEPTQATQVRFTFTDVPSAAGANIKNCTGITEIEMYPIIRSFAAGSSTDVLSLNINGREETVKNPDGALIKSTAWLAKEFSATGKDNAAITVLPSDAEDRIMMFVESEDHSSSRLVEVSLRNSADRDPELDADDIDPSKMHAAATSIYAGTGNEGPVEYVLDGRENTYFHTNWSTSQGADVANRHVDLIFDEPTEVGGLRYLPRNSGGDGGRNGQVVTYKIQYKETDNGEWIDLTEGSWPNSTGWKSAEFKTVTAKQVRLVGVDTMTNGGVANTDMSCAELRVMGPNNVNPLPEVENLNVSLPASVNVYGGAASIDLSDEITVSAGDDTFIYGSDYYLTYELNAAKDEVTVIIHGCGSYTGSITRTIAATSHALDTYLLERTIAAGDAITASLDDYLPAGKEALASALAAGKKELADQTSQKAINDAASALNAALLEMRLVPDKEALK